MIRLAGEPDRTAPAASDASTNLPYASILDEPGGIAVICCVPTATTRSSLTITMACCIGGSEGFNSVAPTITFVSGVGGVLHAQQSVRMSASEKRITEAIPFSGIADRAPARPVGMRPVLHRRTNPWRLQSSGYRSV